MQNAPKFWRKPKIWDAAPETAGTPPMKIFKTAPMALAISAISAMPHDAAAGNASGTRAKEMPGIEMTLEAGGKSFGVSLCDSGPAKALAKLAPFSAAMRDLNGNEKYFYMPSPIPPDPRAVKSINAGDIMLFGPDCLVIFYKSFRTSYSYTRLGRVEDPADLPRALGRGDVKVTLALKPKKHENPQAARPE